VKAIRIECIVDQASSDNRSNLNRTFSTWQYPTKKMTDVEASTQRSGSVNNPYSGQAPIPPHWEPINVLRRGLYMGGSLYGLDYFETYDALMKSPKVRHEWFKIGLAATVGK
jgi:hypothetical protein